MYLVQCYFPASLVCCNILQKQKNDQWKIKDVIMVVESQQGIRTMTALHTSQLDPEIL